MSRRVWVLMWAAAAAAWMGVAYYLFGLDVGSRSQLLHPDRLTYYALALAAPLLTFYPPGREMRLRGYWLEACLCWSGLIVVVTFASPDVLGMPAYLAFELLLFGAVSSVFTPVGYALGFRLLTLRVHRRDTGRARREGYLLGLFVALSAAMNMAGFYNPLNALLLFLILALVESFALARKPGVELA